MTQIKTFILSIALLLIAQLDILHAQLSIEVKKQGLFDTHVNVDNYPRFSAMIRGIENGSNVQLAVNNILVFEDNRAVKIENVTAPDADNWQRIEWLTSLQSKTDTSLGSIDLMRLFVTYNNRSAAALLEYRLASVSIVNFLDLGQNIIPELNLGEILVGTSDSRSFRIWPQAARLHRGVEQRIAVDSIVVSSSEFRYFDVDGPPFMLTSPFTHDADIIYRPQTNDYKRAKLDLYYDKGRKATLPLIGNTFKIEKRTLLNLVQPNGGELLTPCEVYQIKWTGNVKGLATKIEYTTDFGMNWKLIAYVADSVYNWTVPDDISDNVFMRVSQPLQNNNSRNLEANKIPVTKVAFDSKGDYLLAANRAGIIYEWDLNTYTLARSYSIGNLQYPGEVSESKGLVYFQENNKFVAAYNRYFFFPNNDPDTLAFFDAGTEQPYLKVGLDYPVKEILTDSKRQILVVVPHYDNKIFLYSFTDGTLLRTVDFAQPVAAFAFSQSNDEAVAVLYGNKVVLMNLPDFTTVKEIQIEDIPQIVKTAISPNSKFIGVGCLLPEKVEFTGNRNQMHLIDIETGMIVRTLRAASSNPVGMEFSSTSNMLIAGNEGQPQIAFWDLPANNYSGSIQGNQGMMYDIKVSPNGYEVASTSFSDDNLTIKSFTYPESDLSDGSFRILRTEVLVENVQIEPKYLGTDNNYTITRKICNNGLVPIVIDNAKFKFNRHYLLKTIFNQDTLYPGDCFDFDIVYHPLDTGLIQDTLIFYSCSGEFKMAFESRSLPRNISFFSNPLEFGEVCIGETAIKEFAFIRNNDPVPLLVNMISIEEAGKSAFRIEKFIRDTVLEPNGILNLSMSFVPSVLGATASTLLIHHSDLNNYNFSGKVSGTGIGTEIQVSHNDLRFIPEILQRRLYIDNKSDNEISIVAADIYPFNNYRVLTSFPISIPPQGRTEIEIEWSGNPNGIDTLHILAEPCINRTVVVLGPYYAQSHITMPNVNADPNEEASIKISYMTATDNPYKGELFFESEISIHPRLFFPLSVSSDYGTGEITRNVVVNDRRIIGFRVTGEFPSSGIVASINGVAGLGETDTSLITINNGAINWGSSVTTTSSPGLLRLINLCDDRRILHQFKLFNSISVSPNPTDGNFELNLNVLEQGKVEIEMHDNLGTRLLYMPNVYINSGDNRIFIRGDELPPGVYSVIVKTSSEMIRTKVVIIR